LFIEFSPDGKKIASSGHDELARIWDVESGKLLHQLKGRTVVFFPDGKRIATAGCEDGIVRIWDTESGKELQTIKGIFPEFSPDGKKFFTSHEDEVIKIWDTESMKKLHEVVGTWIHFSPNEKVFATMTGDPIVRIWDIESGKALQEFQGGEQFAGFSPDGKQIFTAARWYYFRVYDAESGKHLRIIQGMPDTLSPDRKKIAMAHWEHESFLLRMRDKAIMKMLIFVDNIITNLPEETQNVVGNVLSNMVDLDCLFDRKDKILVHRIWDIESGKALKKLSGPFAECQSIFSPDGKRLFMPCEEGPLRVFDAESGKELQRLGEPDAGMGYPRAFSPDGKKVVVANISEKGDNVVRIWTLE
jgi:WD40 repeat protein